jgi:hypothetical protein
VEDDNNSDNSTNEKWGNIKAIIKDTNQQLIEHLKIDGSMRNAK